MEVFKLITFVAVAITMTFTLILTTRDSDHSPPPPLQPPRPAASSRRPASRFLQQNARNPKAADHCHKDSGVCDRILAGRNATCCNNKCIDLEHDDKNCGACRRKCASSESCCAGECVILAYDARHCGSCSSRCMPGGHCIYGMCDYA